MKFLLISRHTGGIEVPESEKEAHMNAFSEWLQIIKPSAALPVQAINPTFTIILSIVW